MNSASRMSRSAPQPRDRSSGRPPGIDWTSPAPECRACWRAWLGEGFPRGLVLSQRTAAALATGALAFATAAPAAVVAAEPQHDQGAGRSPRQSDPNDPSFDPGGAETELPDAPDEPDEPDDPEPAPGADPSPPPAATPDPGAGASDGQLGPQAPRHQPEGDHNVPVHNGEDPGPPASDIPAPSAPPGTPPPAAPAAPVGASAATVVLPVGHGRVLAKRHLIVATPSRHTPSRSASAAPDSANVSRVAAPSSPDVTRVAAPLAPTRTAVPIRTAGAGVRTRSGGRSHLVRQGESLWSIARGRLGENASSAAIAHEVARLWRLNRERIGTGNPDIVMAGTRLILR